MSIGGGAAPASPADSGGEPRAPGADAVAGCHCNARESGGGILPPCATAWVVLMRTRRRRLNHVS